MSASLALSMRGPCGCSWRGYSCVTSSESACASLQTTVCSSKGFVAGSTLVFGRHYKKFRTFGFLGFECLSLLVQPRPVLADALAHHHVHHIQLVGLNAFLLPRCTVRELGADVGPECCSSVISGITMPDACLRPFVFRFHSRGCATHTSGPRRGAASGLASSAQRIRVLNSTAAE